jgi:hypothetical protein
MLMFYDFEVFKEDWIVVVINPIEQTEDVIVNDREKLIELYEMSKNKIWIGYNSRKYDQFILKGILLGLNPKSISDYIINERVNGNLIDRRFKNIKLYNYDCMVDKNSLKILEGFMGNDIRETSVDFNIDRKLTVDEITKTIEYCRNDVEQTIKIFMKTKSDFDAQMDLIKTFNLPMDNIGLTQTQLASNILQCRKPIDERYDEFDFQIVDTLKIEKYTQVVDWYKNKSNHNYMKNLKIDIAGVPHIFAWGGLHGCIKEPIHRKGFLLHVDVTSYYPSLMIEYDFLTRNCRKKELYENIYKKRVELKKAGKTKEQKTYKLVLNKTFGASKDKFNKAYDPRQVNNICVNGQLLLLDLIEKLEPYCELIQSNTDGLIIQIDEKDFYLIDDICYEWEQRTKVKLGFDFVDEIWQGDVNNYIFHFEDIEENGNNRNKYERKGGYVKELNELDNDLPIINKAIFDYLVKKIHPEDTIKNCNELKMFQKLVKLSKTYKYAYHNGKRLDEKTFRVFASLDLNDGIIGKQKEIGATIEKFANTPARCFIDNSDVNKKEIPLKLDKQWYIDLAIKRIEDKFGFNANKYEQMELF